MNGQDDLLNKFRKFKGFDQENPYMSEQERLEEEEALAQELSVANNAPEQFIEEAPIQEQPIVDNVPEVSARDSVTNALTDTIVPRLLDEALNPKQDKDIEGLYSRYKQQLDTQGQLSEKSKLRKQQFEDSKLNKEADTSLYDDMLTKYETLRGKQQEDLSAAQQKDRDTEMSNRIMSGGQMINQALSGVKLGDYEGLSANEVKNLKERQGLEDKQIQEQFKISEKIKNIKDDAKTKPEDYKALFDLEQSISKSKELSVGQVQNLMKLRESMNPKVKDAANTLINLLNALPKPKEKKETSDLDKAKIKKTEAETAEILRGKDKKLSVADEKDFLKTKNAAEGSKNFNDLLDNVLNKQLKYTKDTWTGTGLGAWFKDFLGPMAPDTQDLKKGYNTLALEKMKQMFEGMSKAVDSDAERKFFEKSLPNLSTDDRVNVEYLLAAKALNLRKIQESKAKMRWVEQGRDYKQFKGLPPSTILVDANTGDMKLVPRNEFKNYLSRNPKLVTLDEYSEYKVNENVSKTWSARVDEYKKRMSGKDEK